MKVVKIIILVFIAVSVIACSSKPSVPGEKKVSRYVVPETITSRVVDAAAFDFSCPKEKIALTKLNDASYGAEGCGKKARYVLDKCHSMNWASICNAFMSGPIRKI